MLSPTVGSDQILSVLMNDPTTASQRASVLSVADDKSLSGLYALVVQAAHILLDTGGTYDIARAAPGTTGIPSVNTEGTKATFCNGISGFTPIATPTDIWQLLGSGTKTIRVTRIKVSGTATSASSVDLVLIKRSTANSGGTITNPTLCPSDSNDSAATAAVGYYASGSNPTTGTSVGTIRSSRLNLGAAGSAGEVVWDFTTRNAKGIVLRGTSQQISINWGGAAVPSGTTLCIEVEWTEES